MTSMARIPSVAGAATGEPSPRFAAVSPVAPDRRDGDPGSFRSPFAVERRGGRWCLLHGSECLAESASEDEARLALDLAARVYRIGLGDALALESEVARLRARLKRKARSSRLVPGQVTIDEIARAVLVRAGINGSGIEYVRLWRGTRTRRIVLIRRVIARVARRLTRFSFPDLAQALGCESHSSVIDMVAEADEEADRLAREVIRALCGPDCTMDGGES